MKDEDTLPEDTPPSEGDEQEPLSDESEDQGPEEQEYPSQQDAQTSEAEPGFFHADETSADAAPEFPDGAEVSWTASEFVAHEKSIGWFLGLALAAAIIGAVVYLISNDLLSVAVVAVAAVMLGVYATHKPRQVEYRLDRSGIGIGQKHFRYDDFRNFAIIQEEAFSSIVLMPLKRFGTLTTIYYAPADEEKIIAMLSDYLPLDEHKPDAVDRLMRRIRF